MLNELDRIIQALIGLLGISAIARSLLLIFKMVTGGVDDGAALKKQIKNIVIAIIVAGLCITIIEVYTPFRPY